MELIVIAAGNGKRMGDISVPKVLYPVNGVENLRRIVESAIVSQVIDSITLVIKDTSKNIFEEYLKINKYDINIKLVPIQSGLGDGHAILKALEFENDPAGTAIVMWGDAYIQSSGIFNELYEKRTEAEIIVPVVREKNPYVTILSDEHMNIYSADFSKLGETHAEGLHDQSVFSINKSTIYNILEQMHNVLWKNGRYITESKELNFLHAFHCLYNNGSPAKCYITEHPTRSFNSIDEVKQIEQN
jgi:bifunctional N-acetylglucosamine-1-phosphate-uridyltransferase/glucosamine-1-phosphate-acetyltransferase GlmU-like protein